MVIGIKCRLDSDWARKRPALREVTRWIPGVRLQHFDRGCLRRSSQPLLPCLRSPRLPRWRRRPPRPPARRRLAPSPPATASLAVNWSAATSPSDKPVVDYEVQYRAGSSGDWTTSSTYGVTFESIVQSGSDPTWAHNRNPLDLGTVTGDAAAYIERTNGGHHNLAGIYRLKAAVAAVHIRVNGTTDGAATLRSNYTDSPITDLRHNGDSMGANVVTSSATSFELTGEKRGLLANSYIWIDGWDHTSTNAKFPEFEDVTVSSRRLRIQIATASTALNTNISDLTNQQSYQVRVRARNSDGWGNWSVVSTGTPLGTPEAPTGLSSVSGNSQLDVSWSAPGNNGGYAISDYDIQYRALTGQTWGSWTYWQESTVSTSASTTINTGIVNDTTYQVRVRAVNSAGDGDWSDAVTDAAGKPSQPTIQLSTVRRPLPPGQDRQGRTALDHAVLRRERQRGHRLRPALPRVGHEHVVHPTATARSTPAGSRPA